jgi:3-hydroxyacyl-[acyl-carrier-protein] dehydratase
VIEVPFGVTKIIEFLPHRYPFLLVDKVIHYVEGQELTAIKNVTVNEPFFNGHFPGNPVMPGVLIIEALAQAGAILAYITTKSNPSDCIFYLAALNEAKFKQIVQPGDQLQLKVKIVTHKKSFWKITGEATVDGQVACSVEILSAMRKA